MFNALDVIRKMVFIPILIQNCVHAILNQSAALIPGVLSHIPNLNRIMADSMQNWINPLSWRTTTKVSQEALENGTKASA